jgi:hypothetical protein
LIASGVLTVAYCEGLTSTGTRSRVAPPYAAQLARPSEARIPVKVTMGVFGTSRFSEEDVMPISP